MKNKIVFLLLLLIFPLVVFADSRGVTVKYVEKSNVSLYKVNVTNQKATVLLNGNKVTFDIQNMDGNSFNIIKVNNDAYKWISSINGEKNYYYVDLSNYNGTISSIKADNKVVNVYDINGSKKDNYSDGVLYFSIEDIPVVKSYKVKLNITGLGRVVVNGNVYKESAIIEVEASNVIIVVADTGYYFSKCLINNNDITNSFDNNRLTYKSNEKDVINIEFKEKELPKTNNDEPLPDVDVDKPQDDSGKNTPDTNKEEPKSDSNEDYSINGYIIKDGLPVINATVILHSEEHITTTDQNGYYEFNNVSEGEHEILVVTEEEEALGYIMFNVEKSNYNESKKIIKDNVTTIAIKKDSNEVNVDLHIDDNYNITVENVKDVSTTKTANSGFNPLWFVLLIPIILAIVLFIIYKRKNKDEKTSI